MSAVARGEQSVRRSAVKCRRPQPDAKVRLVTFAYAGGGPLTFRSWTRELAPHVEIWTVTLPGRAGRWREPFARDWPELIDELTTAIADDVPGPIALFGHSLGALLAFEVARRLTRIGQPPVHLIVSGRGSPEIVPDLVMPETDEDLLEHVERIYGGVDKRVLASQEVLAHFLPILRADLELARDYRLRPGVALTCPITALTGDADPIAPAAEFEHWGRQTGSSCEITELPGGHFFLVDQEEAVLSKIQDRLAA